MTERKSCKRKNWLFTILYIVVEFVTETTADQKQMFDCLPCQSNYWFVWIEKRCNISEINNITLPIYTSNESCK